MNPQPPQGITPEEFQQGIESFCEWANPPQGEESDNAFLREWMVTPLTEEQTTLLEEEATATLEEVLEWSKEKGDSIIEARGIVFANSTARQRSYTRDLNSMALVRAKMSPEQQVEFTQILFHEFHRGLSMPCEIFDCINATAQQQARAAVEAIGSGGGECLSH